MSLNYLAFNQFMYNTGFFKNLNGYLNLNTFENKKILIFLTNKYFIERHESK